MCEHKTITMAERILMTGTADGLGPIQLQMLALDCALDVKQDAVGVTYTYADQSAIRFGATWILPPKD